jgi:replicative DNA helicase
MRLSAPIYRLKRDAKLLARRDAIALHEAQDRIAQGEGFERWNLLAAHHAADRTSTHLLGQLASGDLVLLAGRREHGKTTLAFELMDEAISAGRSTFYFSLDETSADIEQRRSVVGPPVTANTFVHDTSDDISADHVIERCAAVADGTIIVIDYLQLLDQRRDKAELSLQVETLSTFARTTGAIVVLLAQIDRSFDVSGKTTPDLDDIRLPNPVDLSLFTKAYFIHNGELVAANA